MIIERLIVGDLGTNCYIVADELSQKALVIDPGAEEERIVRKIEDMECKVEQIILTHCHFDHVGGMEKLRSYLRAKAYIHKEDADALLDARKNLSAVFGAPQNFAKADGILEDGDTVSVGGLKLKVIHTPGHSKGGISLYGEGVLFSGDTLFSGSIGRYDFGSREELLLSLKKLLTLPPETKVYPGHGDSTTIGYERKYNPWAQ